MTERMRQQVDSLESRLDNERVMQATTQRTFAAREAVRLPAPTST